MQLTGELNYRNARAILDASRPGIIDEIEKILTHPAHTLEFENGGRQQNLSKQMQDWFADAGWQKEAFCFTIPNMRYDLLKWNIPIEIELGHQRLVFADFFEFMADFDKEEIPGAVMVVTGNPNRYGHSWHCSLDSTARKINAVRELFLVPVLVLGVDP